MPKLNYTQSLKTTADAIKPCDLATYTPHDGYDYMEIMANSQHGAMQANPALGDWPYIVIWHGQRKSGTWSVIEFQEHDLKHWWYQDTPEGREEYAHHVAQLTEYWTERNND